MGLDMSKIKVDPLGLVAAFVLFLILLWSMGCSSSASTPNQGLAGAIWAVAIGPGDPAPVVVPDGDICESCNGTGKVGDGRTMLKCEECNGTGKQ